METFDPNKHTLVCWGCNGKFKIGQIIDETQMLHEQCAKLKQSYIDAGKCSRCGNPGGFWESDVIREFCCRRCHETGRDADYPEPA